jgi:hypothetical protein
MAFIGRIREFVDFVLGLNECERLYAMDCDSNRLFWYFIYCQRTWTEGSARVLLWATDELQRNCSHQHETLALNLVRHFGPFPVYESGPLSFDRMADHKRQASLVEQEAPCELVLHRHNDDLEQPLFYCSSSELRARRYFPNHCLGSAGKAP